MKHFCSLIALAACATSATAQVNTAGLVSEAPGSDDACYIVSYNGYFLTSKGSEVITTPIAPKSPEWTITKGSDGTFSVDNGSRHLAWSEGGATITLSSESQTWDITEANVETAGHYTIAADIAQLFFGEIMNDYDAISIMNDGRIYPWPASWSMSIEEDGMTRDMLFFTTLPAQIDNRDLNPGGGEEGSGEEVEVPDNTIEGDFLANWQLGMQDAKVLTMVAMDEQKIHWGHWNPVRNGVVEYTGAIFSDDIIERFYGNRAKNLYFMLPPNAVKIEYFIKDASKVGMDEGILWSKTYDYSEATNFLLKNKQGTVDVTVDGYPYGKKFNLDLLKDTYYEYYTPGELVAIPCDYTFTEEHPHIMVGYNITYPGEYKDNYKNGQNGNNGIKDGTWFKHTALLPTSITQYAFIMGNDDPDIYGGRPVPYEDYTDYQAILKDEYKWCKNAGLLCFVETEGEGGFPHLDLRFDEVKTTRCYTSDAKVPFVATFTNYGVDPIKTAAIDVTVDGNTRTLHYNDGIAFLEQATIDEDITPPASPLRTLMQIGITKINGKDVALASDVSASIIAIDKAEKVRRMPVIEENTGTWCGWCPRGLVGMEKLRDYYGEDVALIGIHTGQDPRSNGMMDEVLGTFGATGAPTCLVNRLYVADPYNGTNNMKFGIKANTESVARMITEAKVDFAGVALDTKGEHLAVITNTTFNVACDTNPYRLTYVITEDGQSYQQMSYYITQTSDDDKEYYRKNDPDLYALTQKSQPWKPVINDIMEYCSEPMGITGSFADTPIVKGESIEHRHLIMLPRTSAGKAYINELKNCRVIALLIDTESREIVNAAQVSIANALVTDDDLFEGLDSVLAPLADANFAPLYDLQGRPASSAPSHHGIYLQQGRKVMK